MNLKNTGENGHSCPFQASQTDRNVRSPLKQILMLVIGLGIAAQLAVPAWMIARQEWILKNGTRVFFEAGVVDPLDAFRGRYVAVRLTEFDRRDYEFTPGMYHAVLATNELGVARIARLAKEFPEEGGLYVNVRKERYRTLQNPFNRFYMPEKLAPVAEDIYRESTRRNATNSVVLLAVRLHNGRGVVEDLLVDGTPMARAARERLKNKK